MRKALSSVLVGVTALALVSTTVVAASAATAFAGTTCNAIDARKSMNDMPMSADCPTPGGLQANVVPLVTPVQATSPISTTPLAFDRTNGDLLAITKVSGTNDIAFGGNFTLVYTPDGVSHPAVNFAVVDETTGAILYGGQPVKQRDPQRQLRARDHQPERRDLCRRRLRRMGRRASHARRHAVAYWQPSTCCVDRDGELASVNRRERPGDASRQHCCVRGRRLRNRDSCRPLDRGHYLAEVHDRWLHPRAARGPGRTVCGRVVRDV